MSDAMVDLETMSLSKDAAIISIGAVIFDPVSKTVFHDKPDFTFYRIVNLKSAQRAGGRMDASTVLWWLTQNEVAQEELLRSDAVPIETALKDFSAWLRGCSVRGVWGNGAGFDNVVLESAYERLGYQPAWSYKDNRCYRTLAALSPQVQRQPYGVVHNALDDAVGQALHLCEILRFMEGKSNGQWVAAKN